MKKKRFIFLAIFACAAMIFCLCACGGSDKSGSDEVITWKLQSSYGPGDQTWDIQMPMLVDAIEKATDGKLKIETYQPGAICEPEQAPASVKKGLLECALSTAGDTGVLIPAAYAEQGIPYYWEDQNDMFDTYYEFGLMDFLREAYAKEDLYYGTPIPNGKYALMTSFPIREISDVKGKKIRAVSSWANFVEDLGGTPVSSITGGEIYQAIKLGTVDGCIYTFAELQGSGLCEVVDYVTAQPPSGSGYVNFIINQAAWDALPADMQDAVNTAMKDVYADITQACQKADEEAEKFAKDKGVEILPLNDATLKKFKAAGLKTADQVAREHPEAAKGLDMVKAWYDAKNKK